MSVKTAVEDSMPPEIPTRSQFNEITLDIIKNISREFLNEYKNVKIIPRILRL